MRWLTILRLQARETWLEILRDVETSRILDAQRNLEEVDRRLARTRFDLDRLHAPQSIIMAALQRRSKHGR